jgi:hypothetical protein
VFKVVLLLLVLSNVAEDDDRVVHLYGRGFSFKVAQPSGWTLDTRSAPQLANFIFHPTGQDWRRSESVIYARFIPREDETQLEEFLTENRAEFERSCPFADPENTEISRSRDWSSFTIQQFSCPGVRQEVLAVKEVDKYFIMFALSSPNPGTLEAGLPVLHTITGSFQWFDTLAQPRPGPED